MSTNLNQFKCVCGRILKSQSGFTTHTKKCEKIKDAMSNAIDDIKIGGMNEETFMFYNSFKVLERLVCTKPLNDPSSKIMFVVNLSKIGSKDDRDYYIRNGFSGPEVTRCFNFLKLAIGHFLIDTVENKFYRMLRTKKESKEPISNINSIFHKEGNTNIRYGLENFDNMIYLLNQKMEVEDITDRLDDSIKETSMRKLKESLPYFKMHKVLNPDDEEVAIRNKILEAYRGLDGEQC